MICHEQYHTPQRLVDTKPWFGDGCVRALTWSMHSISACRVAFFFSFTKLREAAITAPSATNTQPCSQPQAISQGLSLEIKLRRAAIAFDLTTGTSETPRATSATARSRSAMLSELKRCGGGRSGGVTALLERRLHPAVVGSAEGRDGGGSCSAGRLLLRGGLHCGCVAGKGYCMGWSRCCCRRWR